MSLEKELPAKIRARIRRNKVFTKALVIAGIIKSMNIPPDVLQGEQSLIHALSSEVL